MHVLLGYDGSLHAAAAIDAAAQLLPGARATIVTLWTPPIVEPSVRDPLARRAKNLDELVGLVEHEGAVEAQRLAANGAAIATAAGWTAAPQTRRVFGGQGYELARVAAELSCDVLGSAREAWAVCAPSSGAPQTWRCTSAPCPRWSCHIRC